MTDHKLLKGIYRRDFGYVADNWERICKDHEKEFPQIRACHPGTLNVLLDVPYKPPGEDGYRGHPRRNYISPLAKITEINDKRLEAWLYRGGHGDEKLELLATCNLVDKFSLRPGDKVTLTVIELSREEEPGMPGPPPKKI